MPAIRAKNRTISGMLYSSEVIVSSLGSGPVIPYHRENGRAGQSRRRQRCCRLADTPGRGQQTNVPVAMFASQMHFSSGTVRNHVSSVLEKLVTQNRPDAVKITEEQDWI
jgi:hypothetical protein